MLRAENITRIYGRKNGAPQKAVDDVSLTVNDDSVTVIVGESGSGKSTLVRILSYIERPDSGKVILDDKDITSCKAKELRSLRSRVQLVMQDAGSSLDPHQPAFRILDEPLRLLLKMNKSARQERIAKLFELVRLPAELSRHRVSELSGGQQKRLCIARALAAEPRYIIFDESFSGLDVTLRKQILSMLKDIRRELNIGFLIITHDLDTAMYMADRIYVMRCGKIIETVDDPQSFFDFREDYSKELVRAAEYKMNALNN